MKNINSQTVLKMKINDEGKICTKFLQVFNAYFEQILFDTSLIIWHLKQIKKPKSNRK